jgi:hypothetical protein
LAVIAAVSTSTQARWRAISASAAAPFQLAWVALVAWVTDPTEDCA